MCGSKQKASETTDNITQNDNLYLKKGEMYCTVPLFTYTGIIRGVT